MPIYPCVCKKCGKTEDVSMGIREYSADKMPPCCGEVMARVITSPSIAMMDAISPFKSPVDGSWIETRRQREEHNRRNGVIDVGNEKPDLKPKEIESPEGLKETIGRTLHEQRLRAG